jgi:hypothetical protein
MKKIIGKKSYIINYEEKERKYIHEGLLKKN